MPRQRDPNFLTGHLCRFCGEAVPWETILRLIRVDPDTPPYVLQESACHTECLRGHLRRQACARKIVVSPPFRYKPAAGSFTRCVA